MKKLSVLLISALIVFSLGCARHKPNGASWETDNVPTGTMQIMAAEAAHVLAADYPPGHTQLHVIPVGAKSAQKFAPILENAFRSKGFNVLAEAGSEAVSVLYKLDSLKDESSAWYLNIRDRKSVV